MIQLDTVIATVTAQISQLEQEIADVLADGAWARSACLLQSIPGVGMLTAAWLLVTTVNFTVSSTPTGLAAYAGLAPMPHESGTSIRGQPRIGHSGNRRLRHALYMATLSASRHNPMIREFYQRLRDAGKPMKVARCAAARKLLHLAWAVVRKEQAFDPAHR
jgi:transposase